MTSDTLSNHADHTVHDVQNDDDGELIIGRFAEIELDSHVDDRHDDAAQVDDALDELGRVGNPADSVIAAQLLHFLNIDAVLVFAIVFAKAKGEKYFGNHEPFSASPLDSVATVQITCETNKNSDTVIATATLGTGSAGSYANRLLLGRAGNNLSYNIYGDAARTVVFGDGSPGTSALQVAMVLIKNTPRTITANLFGRIFAGQDPAVDSYNDILIYTVSF
jgi:spore coat protein U-like protein